MLKCDLSHMLKTGYLGKKTMCSWETEASSDFFCRVFAIVIQEAVVSLH